MARTDNTKTLWQVQVRMVRGGKWLNKGQFETRKAARSRADALRYVHHHRFINDDDSLQIEGVPGYGFGNTRVIRHIRGEKK